MVDYKKIPAHIMPGLERYLKHGVQPGHTLSAAIANDLLGFVAHADPDTLRAVQHIVGWVANRLPPQARGSYEAMEAWEGTHADVCSQ
jgi:hypothetical protein